MGRRPKSTQFDGKAPTSEVAAVEGRWVRRRQVHVLTQAADWVEIAVGLADIGGTTVGGEG